MSDHLLSAEELREAFDRSFAEPRAIADEAFDDFLLIRVSSRAYAVEVRELAGLYTDRLVVPLPSPSPELRGLTALRGKLAPVYDLGLLLNRAPLEQPRWLFVARERTVAFSFDALMAHARVQRKPGEHAALQAAQASSTVEVRGSAYPVLSIALLLEALAQEQRHFATPKEP